MRCLALDLGTKTGWAFKDVFIYSGTQDFSPTRGDSPGLRFLKFNRWLSEICESGEKLDLIIYERPHQRGGAPTEIAYGFSTRVQEYAAANEILTAAVHTATLKKYATGSGKANKQEMFEAAIQRFPEQFNPSDTDNFDKGLIRDNDPLMDQADALWLLDYAINEL